MPCLVFMWIKPVSQAVSLNHCTVIAFIIIPGLSAEGAAAKWNRDFNNRSIRKDQVESLTENGEPSGRRVWRIFVEKTTEARDIQYKDWDWDGGDRIGIKGILTDTSTVLRDSN